jgi:general secretion pathway protein N
VTVWTRRLAWLGGIAGLLVALALFAPARWLADGVTAATAGQVQLVNARGTLWQGRADLLFTGGEGSRTQTALPQGVAWRLRPTLVAGMPALAVALSAPCCTSTPLDATVVPRWGGVQVELAAFDSRWPAELLSGLGTPWNTLRMEGQLALQSSGLSLRVDRGRSSLQGVLTLDALDIGSRLATLRPLGSYRLELRAAADGNTATLNLSTLRGDLLLQGSGQWVGGRLRFRGEAQAAAGREVALTNLLNIMGKRQGALSVFSVG